MSIEAMKQAHDLSLDGKHFEARQLLLEAIEEAENAPPKREWVWLTDEQISLGHFNINPGDWNNLNYEKSWEEGFIAGAKFSQEKLKELNHVL
jgi:hypothetical protein